MLSRKPQVEAHKKSAEGKLAVRLELLKTKGMDAKQIEKDSIIKQLKAKIRKAKHQMDGIAAMETLTAEKADAKARKVAAAKAPQPAPKKAPKSAAPKKPKKEKKPAAEE